MWYTGINQDADIALGYATSPDGLIWSRYSNPFFGGDDFQNPAMVKIDENYYLWFTYDDGFAARIYHAATAPGYWLYLRGLSLDVGEPGQWDWLNVYAPSVIRVGEEFHLYYSGQTLPPAYQIGYAISQDGFEWDRQGVVIPEGKPGKFDAQSADYPSVSKDGNTFKVWYSGADENGKYTIGYAAGKACSPGGPSTDSQQVFVPVIQKSPGCQTPFYKDDFSDAQSGWPVLDDADLTLAYDEGEYQFLIKNPYQGWGVTPGAKVANFTTSVTARRLSGRYASYGIRFGINKDWSQFYDVIVSDQYFSIWRYSGSWTTLQDWTYSSAIAAGTNANRIKVIRNGWNIILFINGQYLAGISDGTLQGLRRVGLIAASADASEEFRFDDFSLYPASCGPEANLALQEQGLFEMSNPEVHSSPLPPALKP
ncbi:MAG TPA: hypothetical protein VJ436_04610, partial [Anaerolineales bacterium]|nr:hypothetical protein [Anaerolineales bacterium]